MNTSSMLSSFTMGLAASGLLAACGGNVSTTSGTGAGGEAGNGGATTSTLTGGGGTGQGGTAQGGTGGQGGSGGATGGAVCGGKQGLQCSLTEYCEYGDTAPCGNADGTGVCLPRPEVCPKNCPGVCGCDGMKYCNECLANAAGIDVDPSTSCPAAGDCQAITDSIAEQSGGVKTCTTLVRLDYQTKAIKSFHLACAPYAVTTEAQARMTAQTDTGFGQNGQFLSGPNPEDEYVFWEAPGDFGGAGVVNARNGKTVFGGGVVWDGAGEISYPSSFSEPSLLGLGCPSMAPDPQARGFELAGGQPLPQAQVDAAVQVVWNTALPDGLWQSGYVFDVVVLLYPPTVGALDPQTAEWLVLVNSGWLD